MTAAAPKDYLRKIQVKNILGKDFDPTGFEDPETLFVAFGQVDAIIPETGFLGPYMTLRGDFDVLRVEDGTMVSGAKLVLPDPVNVRVAEHLLNMPNHKKRFAVTVGVTPCDNRAGYVWDAEILFVEFVNRPAFEMRERILTFDAVKAILPELA